MALKGTTRDLLLVLLAFAACSAAIFGRSFPPGRLFIPLHSERLMPWRAELAPERSAELAHHELTDLTDKLISFRADDAITLAAWRAGKLPLWNPTSAGGVPHLAQGLYGVFYPPHLLMRWLAPERAYGFLAALHHFLAALFTFLLLRRIGCHAAGAFLGGLAFGFSTYLLMRAHYYQYASCFAWLPLGLLLVEIWFERRSLAQLALLSLVAATVLLSGWPQTAVYTIFCWIALALYRAAVIDLQAGWSRVLGAALLVAAAGTAALPFLNENQRLVLLAFAPHAALLLVFLASPGKRAFLGRMLLFGSALAVGLLIASLQYLPAVEWMPWANRGGLGAPEQQVQFGLRPLFLLDALLPGFFGAPGFSCQHSIFHLTRLFALAPADLLEDPAQLGNLVENTVYFGLLPLCLAALGLLARAARRGFLAFLALLFGAFALGVPAFVYPLYFSGFFAGADPRRALGALVFACCCLAGLGLSVVVRGGARRTARALAALLLAAAAAALAMAALAADDTLLAPFTAWAREVGHELGTGGAIPAGALAANAELVRGVLLRAGAAGALSAAALFLLATRLRPIWRMGPALVVAGVDLLLVALPLTGAQPAAGFLGGHPLIEHLRRTCARDGRLARYDAGGQPSPVTVPLPPNVAGCYGLLDAWCYTVSPPRRFLQIAERIDPSWRLGGSVYIPPLSRPEHLASRALDLMGVRAILGCGEPPAPLPPGIVLDLRFGACFVLRNERALPRAFTVAAAEDGRLLGDAARLDRLLAPDFDARATVLLEGGELPDCGLCAAADLPAAEIATEEPERVVVRLSGGSSAGILVLLDSYAPGWEATVDGEAAPVLLADHAFRAVPFGRNVREIVLEYRPRSVAAGLPLSLAGLGLALLGLLLGIAHDRRRPAEQAAGAKSPTASVPACEASGPLPPP
ncbi:MAG: hypothetical protein HY812_18495 [Planctomycetes bacterium]|nr:hypothetical protein [Planctomycetota bacterium]